MRIGHITSAFTTGSSRAAPFQRAKRGIPPGRWRAATAGLAAGMLLLGACASDESAQFKPVEGFTGLVAGDEPRAVVVGRDVLAMGGSAADAAVAMYFTMAVTMPSRASLGGGGVCVYFDGATEQGEAIEFLARPAASGGMVPSGIRAMAVLHARHGMLRWERLLAPAETLARFGHAVSRAFARDLTADAETIAANPEVMRLFMARSGRLATTGDRIVQTELSAVLGGIRQKGAGYVHGGTFARRLADASSAAGLPLTVSDVRETLPELTPALAVPVNDDTAYFAPPKTTGGVVAAQIWTALTEAETYEDPDDAGLHLFAEAAARAFAQRAAWMAPDGSSREPMADLVAEKRIVAMMADFRDERHQAADGFSPPPAEISTASPAAGFIVGDRRGNAAACTLTMNRLFGSGRLASDTGILLAAPPRSPNDGSNMLTAVVVGNASNGEVRFAGTAAGGAPGATALARVMLETLAHERPLATAIKAPRVHHGGAPDVLLLEPGIDESVQAKLRGRGHTLREVPALGVVSAFHCADGLVRSPGTCNVAADPRGSGMASEGQ